MDVKKPLLRWLIFFLNLVCFSAGQSDVQGLFIDRLSLSNVGVTSNYCENTNTLGLNNSINNFTYNWRIPQSQIFSYALSVHNYQMQIANQFFSFIVELENVTTTKADIYLDTNTSSQWVFCITFNVVINTVQLDYMELITYKNSFVILAKPSRITKYVTNAANQSVPVYEEWEQFHIPSSKFRFDVNMPQIVVYAFLQWITFNAVPAIDQHFVYTYGIIPGSSFTLLKFRSFGPAVNSLNSFKINILVVDCSASITNLASYSTYWTSAMPFSTNFNAPTLFGHPLTDNYCFYSLYAANRSLSDVSYFLFVVTNPDISQANSSLNQHHLVPFCIVTCPSDKFVDYSVSSSACLFCNAYLLNCVKCISKSTCIQCKPVAALVNKICIHCFNLIEDCSLCLNASECSKCFGGKLVKGGCTKIAGCTQVVQIFYPSLHSACYACDEISFNYNLTTHICDCKAGWIVGDYCTSVIGCTSTQLISGRVVCTFCNLLGHFLLQNEACVCASGYQLKGETCVGICGDGIIADQQCDDGNLIDGDGCSHDCKNEYYYKCTKDMNVSSLCSYLGNKIQINLTSMEKVQGENQAVFIFKFTPVLLNLAKLDLRNYFFFNCQNASYSVQKWEFVNGYAKLIVNYETDLENQNASVNFNFDGVYVDHAPMQINFTVKGNYSKITYYYLSLLQKFFAGLLFSLTIIALIMVVLCSWLHKMVGVQYLFLLQIVYYAHFGLLNYETKIGIFQYLGMAAFNYRSYTFAAINFELYQSRQVLEYSSSTADISEIALIALIAFLFILPLLLKYFCPKKVSKLKIVRRILQQNLIYTELISPVTLSYAFPLFFISWTYALNRNQFENSTVWTVLRSIFLLFLIGLYFVNANLVLQRWLLFPVISNDNSNYFVQKAKVSYLPLFQFIMLSSIVVSWFWLRINFEFGLLALMGVLGTMLALQLILRPYQSKLDNLGIDLNMATALVFLLLAFLQNKSIMLFNIFNVDNLRYFVFSALTVCCIVSIIRLASAFRQRGKSKKSLQEQVKKALDQDLQTKVTLRNVLKKDLKQREFIDRDEIFEMQTRSKKLLLEKRQPVFRRDQIKEKEATQSTLQRQVDPQYIKMVSSLRKQFRQDKLKIQERNQLFQNQIVKI